MPETATSALMLLNFSIDGNAHTNFEDTAHLHTEMYRI
jgi:hypothetical protein